MPNTCIECNRLQKEFDDALCSHAEKLAQSFDARNDHDSALLLKLEPGALGVEHLRDTTRQALITHQATHHEKEGED